MSNPSNSSRTTPQTTTDRASRDERQNPPSKVQNENAAKYKRNIDDLNRVRDSEIERALSDHRR
jgi:hypothetical protein